MPAIGKNSVDIGPGHNANTLMPLGFNSSRKPLEKLMTYALVEEYTVIRGLGTKEAIEQTFSMYPPFCIYGAKRAERTVSARQFKSTIPPCSKGSNSSTYPILPKPALLISAFTCGFSVFKSSGDRIECTGCHRKILYGEDKRLRGDGSEFPFAYVNDWYEYQKNYVNAFDPLDHTEEPLFTDSADLYEVIPYKRKRIICENTNIRLYGDRVEIREGDPAKDSPDRIFPFKKVSGATVLGRNKLNLYYDSEIFQIKGGRRFNALKYVNFCYRYKNRVSEEENGEFLGL